MAEREQEKGSSSQNVNNILHIRERGTHIEIRLSDSSSFFIMHDDIDSVKKIEDKQLSESDILMLEYLDEVCKAYTKALSLLAVSPSTCFLMKQKLVKRGFSRNSAGRAVEKLSCKGILDDREYARSWISVRLRRNPEGIPALKAGLMSRGIPADAADEILSETVDRDMLEEALDRAMEKQLRKKGILPDKIKKSLYTKGFPLNLINSRLENLSQE